MEASRAKKRRFAVVFIFAFIVLNLVTFIIAYPEVFRIDPGCCTNHPLAKDFSAYYTAAWRLFHDPSNTYTKGNVSDGGPVILPQPEPYKYLPSFLFLILPLELLGYINALVLFDVIQFLLLVPIAYMLYRLLEKRSLAVIAIVSLVVLFQPLPLPNWGLSVSYYWQWAEGQAK